MLLGERPITESSRTLLGQPTPCVGRDHELRTLTGLCDRALTDRVAHAVLITAAAGVGKSRLRYELLRDLRRRAETTPVDVWLCRGDPMSAGSPFGLLAPMLRREAGIVDGESLDVRRRKLRARVGRHVGIADRERVTTFVGELAGVPFSESDSAPLEIARRDPILMGDQMRRAWEDFLAAECAARPLVVVLEDLQWGDLPTVRFIDVALAHLAEAPLFVLALARPEVDEIFPRIWGARDLTVMRLKPLSRKPAVELARAVLGPDASDAIVDRLVERASGNAFYLEELLRAEREGKGDAPPETVLALVGARLERLPGEARRLLRAAAVFGQVFWRHGAEALLHSIDDATLAELVERELIATRPGSRFPGTSEHVFRHALVRDAAYAMLTEEDRRLGHRLAGEWLQKSGERDAVVLAEHFERGSSPAEALRYYREAAAQALEGNDFAATISRVERGVACGAAGEELGALKLLEAEARRWRSEFTEAASAAVAALELLVRPSPAFYKAASECAAAFGALADVPRLLALTERLREPDRPEDTGARIIAGAQMVVQLNHLGRYALAQSLLDELRQSRAAGSSQIVIAWLARAATMRAATDIQPGALLGACVSSIMGFTAAGDLRMACFQQLNLGYAYIVIGNWALADRVLVEACAGAHRLGLVHIENSTRAYRGWALASSGDAAGLVLLREAIAAMGARGERRMQNRARNYLARALAARGDLVEAAAEADACVAACNELPPMQALAHITAAHIALARDRAAEALAHTRAALATRAAHGSIEDGDLFLAVTHAEALFANGLTDEARRTIAEAERVLLQRAHDLLDADVRRSFLEAVPEHARTMALANQLRG